MAFQEVEASQESQSWSSIYAWVGLSGGPAETVEEPPHIGVKDALQNEDQHLSIAQHEPLAIGMKDASQEDSQHLSIAAWLGLSGTSAEADEEQPCDDTKEDMPRPLSVGTISLGDEILANESPAFTPGATPRTLTAAIADAIKTGAIRVEDGYVYLSGAVDPAIVRMKVKLSALEQLAAVRSFKHYATQACEIASILYDKAKISVRARGTFALEKVHVSYSRAHTLAAAYSALVAERIVQLYSSSSFKLSVQLQVLNMPRLIYFKDGFACARCQVGDIVVSARAKGQFARQEALTACAKVLAIAQIGVPPLLKNKSAALKGRIGNARVYVFSEFLRSVDSTLEPIYTRVSSVKVTALEAYDYSKSSTLSLVGDTMKAAQTKTSALSVQLRNTILPDELKASGVAGAAVLGTGVGAAGFIAGGAVGAAVGVFPAVFTLGLSIPIGAAIGSSAGFCAGAAAGGAAGFAGGKMVAQGIQTHKAELDKGVSIALTKASACTDFVREKLTPRGMRNSEEFNVRQISPTGYSQL